MSPILVTGAHRTGTTWVGKMLTGSGEAAYISEPMNKLHRHGVLRALTPYWYTYICAKNDQAYLAAFQETLEYQYHWWPEILSIRSGKDLLRMGRDGRIFLTAKVRRQRPLLKDPFAVFSIPWFVQRLDCRVVVTVRHPAAFASSLKRLNWPFEFQDLLSQSDLMDDWLDPFRGEIEQAVKTSISSDLDIVIQASLLWRLIYQVVEWMRLQIPQILVVRHEDLSLNPLESYQVLYQALELDFNHTARRMILESSSSENPKEGSKKNVYATHLNSRANLDNWKRRLSSNEIEHIHRITADIAQIYYPEFSWD